MDDIVSNLDEVLRPKALELIAALPEYVKLEKRDDWPKTRSLTVVYNGVRFGYVEFDTTGYSSRSQVVMIVNSRRCKKRRLTKLESAVLTITEMCKPWTSEEVAQREASDLAKRQSGALRYFDEQRAIILRTERDKVLEVLDAVANHRTTPVDVGYACDILGRIEALKADAVRIYRLEEFPEDVS